MAATKTKFEVRSYTNNGAGWEYNGDGWDAAGENAADVLHQEAVNGDWSAYGKTEECKLKAFNEDCEEVGSLVFSPHNSSCDRCGATGLEYGDLLTLADESRICGRCEHASK